MQHASVIHTQISDLGYRYVTLDLGGLTPGTLTNTWIMNSEEIRLDTDRSRRINMPEAIYCEGKTTEQCVQAVSEMLHNESFTDAIIATELTQSNTLRS